MAIIINGNEIAAILVAFGGIVGTVLNYAKQHEQGKRVDRLSQMVKDTQAVVGDVRADHLPSNVLLDTVRVMATNAATEYAKDAITNALAVAPQTTGLTTPAAVVNVDTTGNTDGQVSSDDSQPSPGSDDIEAALSVLSAALRKKS